MKETTKTIQFGEKVEGYDIPVLNEREVRAASGILFLFMFIAITVAISSQNFVMLKYMVSIFMVDMAIRVLINPKFSPTLIMGRLIVRKQVPLYVGAPQKKFAWVVGLVLSVTIFTLLTVLNTYSIITGLICLICLIFLFFETAFGICIGCKLYRIFNKKQAKYCPGEVCAISERQDIQKTSISQIMMIFALIAYVFILVYLFNDTFAQRPTDLWEMLG
ncbi:MAG: DUF4395 domain-containing protein [Flavobacteriaceae bacterium]|nr:DUF4395 domain-containing protein [Flavobacteriaceae bacterium]